MKKLTAWALSAAMLSSMLPAPVFAAGSNAAKTLETVTKTVAVSPEIDLPSNDELFAYYADQVLYGYEMATFGTAAREKLSTLEQKIYDTLKPQIEAVAKNGGSTVFTLPELSELTTLGLKTTWTVTELADYEGAKSVDKLVEAAYESVGFTNVRDALLSDCPFDLYWFDKTKGTGMGISYYGNDADGYTITNLENACFIVAGAYQDTNAKDKTCAVTSGVAKVSTAKTNAAAVIADVEGLSTFDKLVAYKQYICNAVEYDHSAADDNTNTPYGDPWQLISVFDGDSTTNVVCEGYSKAFQYLCDLSSIPCVSVSGVMGGPHMWNVVTLNSQNYLVDLTNCDEATEDGKVSVGQPDLLFMQAPLSKRAGNATYPVVYTFDGYGDYTATYYCDDLNLAAESCPLDYLIVTNAENGTVTVSDGDNRANKGESVTLTVTPGEGCDLEKLTVKEQYGSDIQLDENNQFTMPAGTVIVTAEFKGHEHSWSYSNENNDATIEAKCSGCDETGTVTLSASNKTYDGQAVVAEVSKSDVLANETITVAYAVKNGAALNEAPKNAGKYTASITLGEVKLVEVEFEITKADPTYTIPTNLTATYGQKLSEVTLPDGFTWNNPNQLVGPMGNNEGFATYTPADTNNYNTVENLSVPVAVSAKTITDTMVTVPADFTYNGSNIVVLVEGCSKETDYDVEFKRGEATTDDLASAGTITVIVTGTGNYTGTVTKNVTIGRKEITITGAAIADIMYQEGQTEYVLDVTGVTFKDVVEGETVDYTAKAELTGGITFEDGAAQTTADATVTVTLKNDNYTLKSATCPAKVNIVKHTHVWGFSDTTEGDATITATCTGTVGICPIQDKTVTLTLVAPEGDALIYDGNAKTVTVEQSTAGAVTGLPEVTYTGATTDGKAINAGAYTATLTMGGKTATVSFTIGKADPTYTVPTGLTATYGNTLADVKLPAGFTWMDDTQVVGAVGNNKFVATFTPTDKTNYNIVKNVEVTVAVSAKEITEADVTFTADSVPYTGSEQKPTVTVSGLVEGTDYDVTYSADKMINVGTYTVTVTGKGNYSGVVSKTFTITAKEITEADVTVPANVTYNGTSQTPNVTTNLSNNDYTVIYKRGTEVTEDFTNAGTITVTVVGKGNYTGEVSKEFTINKLAISISGATITDLVFNENATAPGTLTVNGVAFKTSTGDTAVPLTLGTDYTATAALTGEYKIAQNVAATVTVTLENGNYTLASTTFTNATVNIVEHTHAWTYTASGAAITATCGNADTCPTKTVTLTLEKPENLTYDSKAKVVTVKPSVEGVFTDLPEVDYGESGNINAGEHTATLTYQGKTATLDFTIDPKPISKDTVDVVFKAMTYDGSAQTPDGTVTTKDGGLTVTGTWKQVTNVADKTEFTANGNFTGTLTDVATGMLKAEQAVPTGLTATAETLKGQANGTITGLTDKMEYVKDTGVGYTVITGNKLENLAAGTYYVRYQETDNYKPGAAAEVIVAEGKPITVTFDANGQEFGAAFAATLTGQSYGLLAKPNPGPTAANSDFAFVGWYKDAACKDTWNFDQDTLTKENVTIYAKWEQKYFEVKVDVKDHEDKAYTNEVTIKLMRGNDEKYSVTGTSAQGSFTFQNHVEAGAYNLVVTYGEDGTKTELITVDGAKTITIKLPASGVKSELTVTNDAVTPDVMVGGLDDEAASVKNDTSGAEKVLVSMDIKGKTKNEVTKEIVEKIEQAIGNTTSTVAYLDISIEKKVDNAATGTPITETTNVIEILIPLGGRYNIKIIRHHDNAAEAFAQNTNKTDGTFYIDTASGYIHIFTKKFSTYAVSSTSSCTITFDVNGGTGSNSTETTTDGTVTLPADPSRIGYTFKGWYTANGTQVTTETVFTGDTIVYAQWTQNSSGNDYSGGNYYTPSAPTYTVSVPARVENGSVSASFQNASKGSTVTLTVTPDEGYELVSLIVTDKNGNELTLTNKGNGKFSFIMPGSKVNIKATFEEIAVEPETPVNPFYDVAEGDYYFDAVLWANENGITSGVGNGQFAPHATCTRAQMVTFLWNAAGCPNVSADYGTFTDVTANDYYYKAVLWANANNITSGTGNGAFSPNQICTRAQMATFLYKFAEGKAEGTSNPFVDVTVGDYYAQPVQWAVENGITSGTGANTFGPNDPCTRAQMVTFLYRLLAE